MPLKQRTVHYSFNGPHLLEAAGEAFREWVSRRDDVDLSAIGTGGELATIAENQRAMFEEVEIEAEADSTKAIRYIHEVSNNQGTYRTELTAATQKHEGWVQIDTHVPRENAAFAAPRLPDFLLRSTQKRSVPLLDGTLKNSFSLTPHVIPIAGVGDLMDEVIDHDDREYTAIVAGTSHYVSFAEWSDKVDKIVKQSQGLASLWLLDPKATEEFNSLVLEEYRVQPGSLHLFQPGVNMQTPSGYRSHRFFSAREVKETDPRFLGKRLFHLSRLNALQTPLNEYLSRADDLLEKKSTARIIESFSPRQTLRQRVSQEALFDVVATQADQLPLDFDIEEPAGPRLRPQPKPKKTVTPPIPPVTPEKIQQPDVDHDADAPIDLSADGVDVADVADEHTQLLSTIHSLADMIELDLPDGKVTSDFLLDVFSLAQLGSRAEGTASKLKETLEAKKRIEKEKEDTESLIETAMEELDEAENKLISEAARSYELSQRLQASGSSESSWPAPAEKYPDKVVDALKRLNEMKFLEFTGSEKTAFKLDDRDYSSTIAKNCWSFFIALNDYAAQWTDKSDNVAKFLESHHTPADLQKHAASESNAVKNNSDHNRERYLPVPAAVRPEERVHMYAHYRLGNADGKAPRLHYYDDMENTSKIYIGYIGPHLTTRMTS